MLSWLTLCRALICGHLNTGLGWIPNGFMLSFCIFVGGLRIRAPKKLGKPSFLEANLASISRDYSYNHSQILKYRIYRWTWIPEKRWNIYRNWPPTFPIFHCIYLWLLHSYLLIYETTSQMPAIFRSWREGVTSSATSDSLQAIFIGFSSWYFSSWINGEEASLWVIGKYRFIYFPSLV